MFCPNCGEFMNVVRKTPLKTQSMRLRACSNANCQSTVKTVESFLLETLSKPIPKEFHQEEKPTEQLKLPIKKELLKPTKKDNLKA